MLHHNCLIPEKSTVYDINTYKTAQQKCVSRYQFVVDCGNAMFNALWEWEEASVRCQRGVMDGRAMGVGGGIHPISDSCNG